MTFSGVTRRFASRTDIRIVLASYGLTWAGVFAFGESSWAAVGVFVLGIAYWLSIEYPIHRFFLHMPQPKAEWARQMHLRLHAAHHGDPENEDLLFLPLWVSLPSGVLVLSVAVLIGGSLGWVFFAGFWSTLVVYEWLHLAIHVRYNSKSPLYRWIQKGHMLHHFKNERYWYGITNPLADYLMGTHPKAGEVESSPTVKTLGFEPVE